MAGRRRRKKFVKPNRDHIADWRERASAVGWPAAEIASLESVLALSKNEQRIVKISPREIVIFEVASFSIGGTSAAGEYSESTIDASGIWRWRYYPPTIPVVRDDREEMPWCTTHGLECAPTSSGCGLTGLIETVSCHCALPRVPWQARSRWLLRGLRKHSSECPVAASLAEEDQRLERERVMRLVGDAKKTLGPVAKPGAVEMKVVKDKARRGVLEGQLGLFDRD